MCFTLVLPYEPVTAMTVGARRSSFSWASFQKPCWMRASTGAREALAATSVSGSACTPRIQNGSRAAGSAGHSARATAYSAVSPSATDRMRLTRAVSTSFFLAAFSGLSSTAATASRARPAAHLAYASHSVASGAASAAPQQASRGRVARLSKARAAAIHRKKRGPSYSSC